MILSAVLILAVIVLATIFHQDLVRLINQNEDYRPPELRPGSMVRYLENEDVRRWTLEEPWRKYRSVPVVVGIRKMIDATQRQDEQIERD
jgi:hypothetical protein